MMEQDEKVGAEAVESNSLSLLSYNTKHKKKADELLNQLKYITKILK